MRARQPCPSTRPLNALAGQVRDWLGTRSGHSTRPRRHASAGGPSRMEPEGVEPPGNARISRRRREFCEARSARRSAVCAGVEGGSRCGDEGCPNGRTGFAHVAAGGRRRQHSAGPRPRAPRRRVGRPAARCASDDRRGARRQPLIAASTSFSTRSTSSSGGASPKIISSAMAVYSGRIAVRTSSLGTSRSEPGTASSYIAFGSR